MADHNKTFELRCPVHGFITINTWERDVINHPAFQRLRRIRQLAWTDYVYPGAMHTRFEHSLGVMHIASQFFRALLRRSKDDVKTRYSLTDDDLEKDEQILRLACLLHDTGHGPFSHAAEELFPKNLATGKPFKHEAYSAIVIRHCLKEAIEGHADNARFGITADEVADLFEGKPNAGHRLLWRQLIDGQMDADRMDYLLRDSLHVGVDYGRYDWRRLLNTIQIIEMPPTGGPDDPPPDPRIGVTQGGIHAAEALVLARYYMFTQVYFHKTRVAYDIHIREALKEMLPGGTFPPPTEEGIRDYLKWDDWRVLGLLSQEAGGPHGDRLRRRDHYREVYHTPECPSDGDLDALNLIKRSLGDLVVETVPSKTSTYKLDSNDIQVVSEDALKKVRPLSLHSPVVKNLNQISLGIVRLYSDSNKAAEARAKVFDLLGETR